MSNYPELIHRIFSHSKESKIQAFRKLIYLAVNDQKRFSEHVPQIAQQLPKALTQIEDEQVKLLSLQLLSEMATNYTSKIPANCYSFPQLVSLLSDDNAEVRKGAHYLILIFIKKYQQIDEVIEGYLDCIKASPEHWKVLQKIIHSFQSLLVIQPKCVTYGQDYTHMDDFMQELLNNRNHHHSLVQKASQQTVSSFVKNQYVPKILPKLDTKITEQLVQFAKKISVTLQLPRKISPYKQPQDDIDVIKISHRKTSVLDQLLQKLDSENDWRIKSETIQQICRQLSGGSSDFPEDLLEKVLDLTYDYNFKTCISAMNALLTIVTDYHSKISSKYRQIQDVVIDKICDLKMAVRQLANKILRKLFSNHTKDFFKRILNKLNNCSIVGKQQILAFLQETFTNNILADPNLVLGQISNQLLNQNTRVKIKAIDCLVKISIANDLEECKLILSKKLKKVYYDMFQERLRQKLGMEKPETWEEKSKVKKGMTWQAPQRVTPIVQSEQSLTKVEFGNNKKNFFETQQDFAYINPIQKTKEKPFGATSNYSYKTANTFNSFDTFKSEQTNLDKKKSQISQPSSFLSYEKEIQKNEEKKLPIKPNPVRKRNNIQVKQEQKQDKNVLVIESKQYMNKNTDEIILPPQKDEIKSNLVEQKPKMKINRSKIRQKSNLKQKQQQYKQQKPMKNQPFSIKKSGSKKQHTIDYKATHYAAKQELAPVDNPKQMFKTVMTNLPKDNDWNKQFQGLDGLRRLIKNHHDFYPNISQNLAGIMPEILKLIESLRSSVAKNAMITLSQMCEAMKKSMDAYVQPLFVKLFKKAQDANTFIVQEVRKCMTSLCTYCSTSKIAAIIVSNSNSKSAAVKTKAALCIDKVLQKKNYDCQTLKQNPKLINVMSAMIIDSSSEVRSLTKQIFIQLMDNNNTSEVQGLFKRASTKDAWQKWKNIMDKEFQLQRRN